MMKWLSRIFSSKSVPIELADVLRAPLNPGDMVVVSIDAWLRSEQRELVYVKLKDTFPHNNVFLLEGGMKICILAREKVEHGVICNNRVN